MFTNRGLSVLILSFLWKRAIASRLRATLHALSRGEVSRHAWTSFLFVSFRNNVAIDIDPIYFSSEPFYGAYYAGDRLDTKETRYTPISFITKHKRIVTPLIINNYKRTLHKLLMTKEIITREMYKAPYKAHTRIVVS